jgi:hypothetical protein
MFPSDLPGVNPATLNGMLLYYRLMTKWSGLGDSTELSRVGLSQPRTTLLENSGKPVTLETSRLMKFVMQVFRGKELTKIWSLELTKSRSRECAVDWSPKLPKPRSREHAMARNLEPAKP